MIPIVCLGCNERAEIPFIPPDLTCVACKTGEHIDLDDSQHTAVNTVVDAWDPVGVLPSGTPDEDRDMPLLRTEDGPRKVVVPEGSTPYTQKALASRKQAVYVAHQWVDSDGFTSCIVCGIPEDEAAPINGPMVGCIGSTPPNDPPPYHDPMDEPISQYASKKVAGQCSNCGGTGAVPAGGGEDPSEVDNGYVKCPTCHGTGTDAPKKSASLLRTASISDVRAMLAQFNGLSVMLTYTDGTGLHTVGGPLVYHPPAVMVGSSATTDVNVLSVTANGYGDASPMTANPDRVMVAKVAGSETDMHCDSCESKFSSEDHTPGDWCPKCGTGPDGGGALRYDDDAEKNMHKRTKIEAAIRQTNPGLPEETVQRVARKTIAKYPKVAADTGPDKPKGTLTFQCEQCNHRFEHNVKTQGVPGPCPACGHEYVGRSNKRPSNAPVGT